MSWNKSPEKLAVCIGLLLIIAGVGVWLVSVVELEGNEVMLANEGLSAEEVWRFEGALKWWRNTYVSAILPVTVILVISGIATIISQPLLSVFREMDALKDFEQKLKQALQ